MCNIHNLHISVIPDHYPKKAPKGLKCVASHKWTATELFIYQLRYSDSKLFQHSLGLLDYDTVIAGIL